MSYNNKMQRSQAGLAIQKPFLLQKYKAYYYAEQSLFA